MMLGSKLQQSTPTLGAGDLKRHCITGLSTRPYGRLPAVHRLAPKVASSGSPSSFGDRPKNGNSKAPGSSVSTSTASAPKMTAASAATAAAAQPPSEDDPLLQSLAIEVAEDEDAKATGAAGWAATIGVVGGIAVLLGGGYVFRDAIKHFLDFFIQAVDDWGVWGYVAYAAVYTGLEVLAVPAIPLTMTAGVIFGPVPGTIIVSCSATLAATIAFLIARYAARDKIMKLAGRNKRFAAIDRAISRNGLKFVTLLRLSPLLPLAASNYLYGLTSVDLGSYVLGSWLGMLPGTYAYVTAGHVGKAVLSEGEGSLGVETWQAAAPGCKPAAPAAFSPCEQTMTDVVLPRLEDSEAAAAAPPGPPDLDLAKWNQAYKITVANITRQQMIMMPSRAACTEQGFDNPTAAKFEHCIFKKHDNGTLTAWRKLPGDRRQYANCLCYALDTFKGGKCNPGTANGTDRIIARDDTKVTCALMKQALVADGAKPVSRDEALKQQPRKGHYIAVMVSTDGCNPYHCWENDYHAARKDSNGLWSWKEPGGPASNKDLFGNLIKDPEAPNITVHYDVFCGYYHVVPSEMTISSEAGKWDMSVNETVEFWSAAFPGASVWAQPLPYNETTDGAFDYSERLMQQDRLWESKRGSKEWQEWYSTKGPDGKGSSAPSPNSSGRKLLM
ncbi:hypothetical protein OEZ86_008005 [Tetradesmus obliquus]|nr:hypothetical protein OEZ86_008005 [Tetradesmus obliquus]